MLVKVPRDLDHGWKCVSETEAYIVNVVTRVYNYEQPDEHRIHPHDNDIHYDWERRDG
jgi:dTDP-4-dehydrorhamnose 3,5-epimerase